MLTSKYFGMLHSRLYFISLILASGILLMGRVTAAQDYPTPDFGLWALNVPDCTGSDIIETGDTGFRINPDWQIQTIQFASQGSAYLAGSTSARQVLERDGAQFLNKDTVVAPALVDDFVASIRNLHSTNQFASIFTFDVSFSLSVRITGTDDEKVDILLSSADLSSPWIIAYNGCLYAQYDGVLVKPLAALFPSLFDRPISDNFMDQQRVDFSAYSIYNPEPPLWIGESPIRWQAPTGFSLLRDELLYDAFMINNNIRQLLENHAIAKASYSASVDPRDIHQGILQGSVVLLGEMPIGEQVIRYTVGVPFVIENGLVTVWNLSNDKLDSILAAIQELPLTQRVVQADPDVILNLWYDEVTSYPNFDFGLMSARPGFHIGLIKCSQAKPENFPSDNEPLIAFSFNGELGFSMPDFLLVDGQPRMVRFDFQPGHDEQSAIRSALLPDEFVGNNLPSFERISVDSSMGGMSYSALYLTLPRASTDLELQSFQTIADSLGGRLTVMDIREWRITGVEFVVNDQGKLEVIPCK